MSLLNEFEKCAEEGLIREIFPSKERAEKSIKRAERWLSEAENNFANKAFDSCLISGYLAMFHAAKSVLIRDGFREKSHFCVARYIEEKYVKTKKLEIAWIDLLDRFRELRHQDQYELDFSATVADSEEIIKNARGFIERVKKLLAD